METMRSSKGAHGVLTRGIRIMMHDRTTARGSATTPPYAAKFADQGFDMRAPRGSLLAALAKKLEVKNIE